MKQIHKYQHDFIFAWPQTTEDTHFTTDFPSDKYLHAVICFLGKRGSRHFPKRNRRRWHILNLTHNTTTRKPYDTKDPAKWQFLIYQLPISLNLLVHIAIYAGSGLTCFRLCHIEKTFISRSKSNDGDLIFHIPLHFINYMFGLTLHKVYYLVLMWLFVILFQNIVWQICYQFSDFVVLNRIAILICEINQNDTFMFMWDDLISVTISCDPHFTVMNITYLIHSQNCLCFTL